MFKKYLKSFLILFLISRAAFGECDFRQRKVKNRSFYITKSEDKEKLKRLSFLKKLGIVATGLLTIDSVHKFFSYFKAFRTGLPTTRINIVVGFNKRLLNVSDVENLNPRYLRNQMVTTQYYVNEAKIFMLKGLTAFSIYGFICYKLSAPLHKEIGNFFVKKYKKLKYKFFVDATS